LPNGLFIDYESRNKRGNTRIHVILKRGRVIIVAVEKHEVLHITRACL